MSFDYFYKEFDKKGKKDNKIRTANKTISTEQLLHETELNKFKYKRDVEKINNTSKFRVNLNDTYFCSSYKVILTVVDLLFYSFSSESATISIASLKKRMS